MTKFAFRPEIIVDAENSVEARNKLLKFLAEAELLGRIYHFQVGEAEA